MADAHKNLLENVLNKLLSYQRYEFVKAELEYKKGKREGEFDILAYDKKYDIYHYYEIKGSDSKKCYNKAMKQFKKARDAFPKRNYNFLLITPKKIYRIDNDCLNRFPNYI